MVFGGAYSTLRRESTVVIGGDVLAGDARRDEKCGEVGGSFVVDE